MSSAVTTALAALRQLDLVVEDHDLTTAKFIEPGRLPGSLDAVVYTTEVPQPQLEKVSTVNESRGPQPRPLTTPRPLPFQFTNSKQRHPQ